MAIPSRQIGGSTTTNLLWQISKQLEELICVRTGNCGGNTTTTTTTGGFFPNEFCVWSTNPFEDPVVTSEYNVATNTLVPVPIDNDLINPIQLGIASTSLKLSFAN